MSVTYSTPWAAKILGVSRPTLDAWIRAGVLKPTGQHNTRMAFTPGDINKAKKVKYDRDLARKTLNLR